MTSIQPNPYIVNAKVNVTDVANKLQTHREEAESETTRDIAQLLGAAAHHFNNSAALSYLSLANDPEVDLKTDPNLLNELLESFRSLTDDLKTFFGTFNKSFGQQSA